MSIENTLYARAFLDIFEDLSLLRIKMFGLEFLRLIEAGMEEIIENNIPNVITIITSRYETKSGICIL